MSRLAVLRDRFGGAGAPLAASDRATEGHEREFHGLCAPEVTCITKGRPDDSRSDNG